VSAANVALPAFAAARRVAAPCCLGAGREQSIDISYTRRAGQRQQTRRTLLQQANGTDRRTDSRKDK